MAKTVVTTERASNSKTEKITRCVRLDGLTPLMLDRYAGDNKTKLAWTQKVYLIQGTNILCLPIRNIMSFLSAHNTNSAPKRLRDKREYKDICNACLSFVYIQGPESSPSDIPILRNGEPIRVGEFDKVHDPLSGIRVDYSVARLPNGVPNPKERPVLDLPWALEFTLQIQPNDEINEQEIRNLFTEGGIAIGFGTYRGLYGKFGVTKWE